MYCDEQDESIFKLQEVYEAIRIDKLPRKPSLLYVVTLAPRPRMLKWLTLLMLQESETQSISFTSNWQPAKPAVLNSPLRPWQWFIGDITFGKLHPAVPMTAYK